MSIEINLVKVCSRCNIEKPITEYHRRDNRKCKTQSHCKKCEALRKKKKGVDFSTPFY